MNISFFIGTHMASSVYEDIKAYIKKNITDVSCDWKNTYAGIETNISVDESVITKVFEELVKLYPELRVYASYSYDIREDDDSAQWWATVTIQSQKDAQGNTKIVRNSSTGWA